MVKTFQVIGSPDYPPDEERLRELSAPASTAATIPPGRPPAARDHRVRGPLPAGCGTCSAPTVVIHGDRDPLVRPAAGRSVATAIPGARLVIIPGMGHDLPRQVWPLIAGELAANAHRAAEPASAFTV